MDGWRDHRVKQGGRWNGRGRERAHLSTLQYKGPPQGGAFSGTLDYSLVVVPSATRAEVEKSTAPFTTCHHFL